MPLDLTFQPFGLWHVLGKGKKTVHGQFWVTQCACGSVPVELLEAALTEGWTKSCGCDHIDSRGCRRSMKDFTGQQYGNRLFLYKIEANTKQNTAYMSRCLCGKEVRVERRDIIKGQCLTCASCRLRKQPQKRWFGELFVIESVGVNGLGQLLVSCRCERCGAVVKRRYADVERLKIKTCGCGQVHNIKNNRDLLLTRMAMGVSKREIAQALGVCRESVRQYVKHHPEILALITSLRDTDILVDDASVPPLQGFAS